MEKYLYSDLYELEEKHWWHKAKRDAATYFIRKFLTSKNLLILDIGCGAGKNIELLTKFGKVWGIDIEIESIKYCKLRNLKNIKKASSTKTGFPTNHFNLVTMLDVLEHTEETKTLKEVHRILKKGGLILTTVPAYPWLWSRWDEVLHHKRRYDKKKLVNVFKSNSFTPLMISYMHPYLIISAFLIRFIRSKLLNHNYYKSDFQINNSFLNSLLYFFSRIQLKLMHLAPIPFGTSLICIAKVEK